MKTLAYHVDITALFNAQDCEKMHIDSETKRKQEEGAINKERLLKIVLPFLHGVMALHNRKCIKSNRSSTGCDGLLGYSKVNIEEKIDFYVNTEKDIIWHDNYQSFTYHGFPSKEIKIWLNSRKGCYQATPHLEYSMTSLFNTYAESIEDELFRIAKMCARYTDDWE
jgi:hypothetical protein